MAQDYNECELVFSLGIIILPKGAVVVQWVGHGSF